MKDELKYAEKMARHWIKKATKLGTVEWFNQERFNQEKEKEKKEEASPHTPYKEKKEEEKEATTATTARARVREEGEIPSWAPSVDEVLAFAAAHTISAAYAKWWHRQMSEVHEWRHPETNCRLISWKRYLELWWKCRFENNDPLADIEREYGNATTDGEVKPKAKSSPFDEIRRRMGQ